MSAFIAKEDATRKAIVDNISGERAAELITSSLSADLNVVNFDEVEASRLKVKLRGLVSVIPTDNGTSWPPSYAILISLLWFSGKVPTVGKLVGLNREEVAVETVGLSGKPAFCHFPRLYYSVRVGVTTVNL